MINQAIYDGKTYSSSDKSFTPSRIGEIFFDGKGDLFKISLNDYIVRADESSGYPKIPFYEAILIEEPRFTTLRFRKINTENEYYQNFWDVPDRYKNAAIEEAMEKALQAQEVKITTATGDEVTYYSDDGYLGREIELALLVGRNVKIKCWQ